MSRSRLARAWCGVAQRHTQMMRGARGGTMPSPRAQRDGVEYKELEFLRELAGTQMFAMYCYQAKRGLKGHPSAAVEADADNFIQDFVRDAAAW